MCLVNALGFSPSLVYGVPSFWFHILWMYLTLLSGAPHTTGRCQVSGTLQPDTLLIALWLWRGLNMWSPRYRAVSPHTAYWSTYCLPFSPNSYANETRMSQIADHLEKTKVLKINIRQQCTANKQKQLEWWDVYIALGCSTSWKACFFSNLGIRKSCQYKFKAVDPARKST